MKCTLGRRIGQYRVRCAIRIQGGVTRKINGANGRDKVVSRWERGIGFSDINTIEPLALALEISVLELIHTQKRSQPNC